MKHLSFPCRDELYPESSDTLPTGLQIPALGFQVGKVQRWTKLLLKSNGDEALNDESL
jgi:hypothetical protein